MAHVVRHPTFRVITYSKPSSKVVFFFCPFGIPAWQLALPLMPIRQLVKHGYQVIAYDYPLRTFTTSAHDTAANIEAILTDVSERIAGLPQNTHIYSYGTSLGATMAANTAARNPRIRKVIFNLGHSDIAEHILTQPAMIFVPARHKHAYIAGAGGAAGLHQILDPYSPLHLAPQLSGRDMLVRLHRMDRLMQYRHTRHLPVVLREAQVRLQYSEGRFTGHWMGCAYTHLHRRRYLRFFEE